MKTRSRVYLLVIIALVLAALPWGLAQAAGPNPNNGKALPHLLQRKVTGADRVAAAANAKAQGLLPGTLGGTAIAAAAPAPGGVPDYFGPYPNYANSPLPSVDPVTGTVTGGIRKFVNELPGLTPAGANNLGQYIPVAVADTTTYPGSDYYEIALVDYTEQMHSDLPPTRLRGYVQIDTGVIPDTPTKVPLTYLDALSTPITLPGTNVQAFGVDKPSYLGPVVIAQKDRPVRVKFYNLLPAGAGGDLFIPVDTTYMGAGMGPLDANGNPCDPSAPGAACEMYTENRATLHLHGGNTPWISDGTPHQWTTPAGENTKYPQGVSVYNVPDMDGGNEPQGVLTFYYTNQQSARLMFYHDHAYGITRLNVYAGEAAGYLLQDPVEQGLVTNNTIPADQIPLVIQDKTFVPDAAQLAAEDPTWDSAKWGGKGNLWFPHVYMPNQNPYDITGANAMGRWDYGPWFWPPFTGIQYGEAPNPYCLPTPPASSTATTWDCSAAPWEPPFIPGTPNVSSTPEAFMDTPVINGTAYPVLKVDPKAYRLRILNAANDRFWNLQLYVAKSQAAMWNPDGTLNDANAGEVNMVAAVPNAVPPLPVNWPTDGRDGGVPDPTAVGPNFIQIGTEGGFLPAPAVIPNQPVNYEYDRRSITVLNVSTHALFLGPAERADVIVDFSAFAGKTLILYNDAPAPVPAFDTRTDYYTGDPDQTANGGAPSTLPGYGPNTRTIMQIQVAPITPAPAYDLAALQTALPVAYAQVQDKPIIGTSSYNTAFGTSYPADGYARIFSTSMSFFNGPLSGLTLINGGAGYSATPTVTITGGGATTNATATAILAPRKVASIALTSGGSGYTSAPTVTLSGGGGAGATATAVLAGRSIASITVTNQGNGYTSTPSVTLSAPPAGGTTATATAVVVNRRVTAINVTNAGSGYTSAPTVTITGGGGSGARATANLAPASVASVTVTNGGANYTSAPTVAFSGGAGSGATATATLTTASVASLTLLTGGAGYTFAPTVTISPAAGDTTGGGATATAVGTRMALQPKAIQELFTQDYGRMNAILGVEIPNTNGVNQTTIPYGYTDPITEVMMNTSDTAAPLGTLGDGTQIWKITHNGVDTHAIHFHMFNVQLINRVGWDGMVKPPEENELGWKDTLKMNPLEDIIVAMRPIIPNIPFQVGNSIRPLDVTMPLGVPVGATNTNNTGVDPTGQPAAITNTMMNFGWEYVWHCHLLGHEENDMMRAMIVAVAPATPGSVSAAVTGNRRVTVSWTDTSVNETGWTVQRLNGTGTWTNVGTVSTGTLARGLGTSTGARMSYVDTTVAKGTTYAYRVIANNLVGYTQVYAAPAVGWPHASADSAPSGVSNSVTP